MAKRKAPKKKRSTKSRKVLKKTVIKKQTKSRTKPKLKSRRKSRTLSKKYSFYNRRLDKVKDFQPPTTKSRSANPTDVAYGSLQSKVLSDVKKAIKMDTKKQDTKTKRAVSKFKSAVKSVGKRTSDIIETTGTVLDKVGAFAEKAAPQLNALALANPEVPMFTYAAGVADMVGGAHAGIHAIINETGRAHEKGDGNRLAVKQLTDTKKYQKLMADVGDEDVHMFTPQTLGMIPYEPGEVRPVAEGWSFDDMHEL